MLKGRVVIANSQFIKNHIAHTFRTIIEASNLLYAGSRNLYGLFGELYFVFPLAIFIFDSRNFIYAS